MKPVRNLILVHTEGWQDVADFVAIKEYVEDIAPDIEVFIASNFSPSSYTRKTGGRRPSLIFSPLRLGTFQPVRGKIYDGKPMSKLVEMQKLAEGGMPVPVFEELRADTVLSEEKYGPYVVVKSSHPLASWGLGMELKRTEDVRYRAPVDYPENHPGHHAPMIVQKFIDCGRAMTCRVLTLFGTPIFTYCRESTVPLALESRHQPFEPRDFMPSPPDSIGYVTHDPDMLSFASAAYQAMPSVALQACDILKSKEGDLYLLEINPGGGTWMFSSGTAAAYRERLGVQNLHAEFDAFRTCARLLVERTRAEAI